MRDEVCSVCTGTEPTHGGPCICGGEGTREAEMRGLRLESLRLREHVAEMAKAQVNFGRIVREFLEQLTESEEKLLRIVREFLEQLTESEEKLLIELEEEEVQVRLKYWEKIKGND